MKLRTCAPLLLIALSCGPEVRRPELFARETSTASRPHEVACERGEANECIKAGNDHREGDGTAVDFTRALKYFDRGCTMSDAASCYNLGHAYWTGEGTAVDLVVAARVYRRSCILGFREGCEVAGRIEAGEPSAVPPKVGDAERETPTAQRERTALRIEAAVPAEVFIDGSHVGPAPAEIEVTAGVHVVKVIALSGDVHDQQTIDVRAGTMQTVVAALGSQSPGVSPPPSEAALEARSTERRAATESLRAECLATEPMLPAKARVLKACRQPNRASGLNRLVISMWDRPRLTNKRASSRGAVYRGDCVARCDCGTGDCFVPEVVYVDQVEPLTPPPLNEAVTRAADVELLLERDLSKGQYPIAHKACYLRAPTAAEVSGSCRSDSGKEVILPRGQVRFIGELSGAVLGFDCDFRCPCDGSACIASVQPPDPTAAAPTATSQERTSAERVLDPDQPMLHYKTMVKLADLPR
jgi:hypothetical protein